MSEQDDIARIAALRGRSLNYYAKLQSEISAAIPDQTFAHIWFGNPNWQDDIEAFDRLPRRSRQFISMCPLQLSSAWWESILSMNAGDEESIINRALASLPARVKDFLMRHYGAKHPNLRRMA